MAQTIKRGFTTDTELIGFRQAGPGSYVTGGFDPGFPASGVPVHLLGGDEQGGYLLQMDYVNKKVKVFWCAGAGAVATEVTAGTNMSGTTFRFMVVWSP